MAADKRQDMRGLTIVELLIVIVVIGILAAITIAAYNGIQHRAKDIVIESAASAVLKGGRLRAAETGSPGLGETEVSTRDDLLEVYRIVELKDRIKFYGESVSDLTQSDYDTPNRELLYVEANQWGVGVSRWSYALNRWVNTHLYDDSGAIGTSEYSGYTPPFNAD